MALTCFSHSIYIMLLHRATSAMIYLWTAIDPPSGIMPSSFNCSRARHGYAQHGIRKMRSILLRQGFRPYPRAVYWKIVPVALEIGPRRVSSHVNPSGTLFVQLPNPNVLPRPMLPLTNSFRYVVKDSHEAFELPTESSRIFSPSHVHGRSGDAASNTKSCLFASMATSVLRSVAYSRTSSMAMAEAVS